ncbi:MAG TPA: bacteriocin [Bacteroidales bacterium]|nr:bacteriocin [Bacteroidales bacterium]HPS95740.1 bacteriocin [Bacteroidales bacterium]
MKTTNTTFENLNEQEMINVIGGDKILQIIDGDGNVVYIVIRDGRN